MIIVVVVCLFQSQEEEACREKVKDFLTRLDSTPTLMAASVKTAGTNSH